MSTMKVARLFGPNDLRMIDMEIPKLGAHDVLCKVERVGICGTDYAIYTGEFSAIKTGDVKFPMTLGHEWSATVAEIGADVENFKVGDRVVGDTVVACGNCNYCLLGAYYRCKQSQAVGTINAWDGAYAEYVVMPERHLFRLPDSISFDQGTFVEPAATSLYAVKRADVGTGDTVLVHGTGPLGVLAAKLSKLCGASKVFITGRKKFKLELALNFGADVAINTLEESFVDVIAEHTNGQGVDRVVEASGSIELFTQSLEVIRAGGNISLVAFYEKMAEQVEIDKFVFGGITLRGVAGSLGMYPPILNLMANGMLNTRPLITGRYKFEDIEQALKDMKDKNTQRIKWIVEMPSSASD